MEQIVIKSIKEIGQYLDQLKQIKIWLCHQCCGKTYLCNSDDRFFDVSDYRWQLCNSGAEDCIAKANAKKNEMINAGYVVLDNFGNHSKENELPFVYIYAKPELQSEYIKRMRDRGQSSEEEIQRYINYFESRQFETAADGKALFKIEMGAGEYLSDYIWKVFGKPKKAHENKLGQFTKKIFNKLAKLFIR